MGSEMCIRDSNGAIQWTMGDWSASWSADYIGESENTTGDVKYKGYTTHNVAVTYDMSDLGTVRVGANNVGNKDPLLDKFGSQVDEYQYSLTGRVIFLEYSIEM